MGRAPGYSPSTIAAEIAGLEAASHLAQAADDASGAALGDPNTAETYDLGNGSLSNVDPRSVTDAGFLELTRMGELPPNDPDVLRSLEVVDALPTARATPVHGPTVITATATYGPDATGRAQETVSNGVGPFTSMHVFAMAIGG